MSAKMEKLEHNMAKFTIEVPVEEFDKAVDSAFKKNKNKISIPGFRKGKVPRQMIEKMYGKDFFFGEAADICIPDAWSKTYDECEEEIVSSPEKIEVVQLEAGKPFIFTAEAALNPVAKIGKYAGVEIEKIDSEVSDEELEEAINKERDEQARMVSVEREVRDGDITIIDYEGFVDGEAFEGGKGENHSLTIGSGSFIPGFEDQIIGHKLEEDFDVNVTFPEDYHADNLAGKEAVFKCRIHEIKEKQVPELDDDFADDAGFDSVEDYKKDLKEKLEKKKAAEVKSKKEDAVIEKIKEDAEMDIPEAMIKTQMRRSLDEFAQQLMMQGLTLKQYFMFTGLDEEKLMEQSRPSAEKRIKSRLILEAVARAEGMEVTEEDYNKTLQEMADEYRMEVDKLKEAIRPEDDKLIRKDALITKALDFIVEKAVEK
ncbi:MAG: trigger factor [Lachnospiraceae bacterium]|nr:trigger factor [Lachnospiraceae bacterium]